MATSTSIPCIFSRNDISFDSALTSALGEVVLLDAGVHFSLIIEDDNAMTANFGEPGQLTIQHLNNLAVANRLLRCDWPDSLPDAPPHIAFEHFAQRELFSSDKLAEWLSQRNVLKALERGKSIPADELRILKGEAAYRCMYPGCGKRVDRISKSNLRGNTGQIAHIVGSKPGGPRGRANSHALSSDPKNNLLLCYDHHREIDDVAPQRHSISSLREMRAAHLLKTAKLLKPLSYPTASKLYIKGGIAGQSAAIDDHETDEALIETGYSPSDKQSQHLERAPITREEGFYGRLLLQTLKPAIISLQADLINDKSLGHPDHKLAIFALHDTPVVVLAGRLIGEGRSTLVFQRDRARFSWGWREPKATAQTIQLKNQVYTPGTASLNKLALLVVCITAPLQPAWLSPELQSLVDKDAIKFVSVEAENFGNDSIGSVHDLQAVADVVRSVLRELEDGYLAAEIHLIIAAPVSVLIRVGQMLQAGHHTPIVIYHRFNFETPFVPSLRLSGRTVTSADPDDTKPYSIELQ